MNRSQQSKQMLKCGGKAKPKKMASGGQTGKCRGGGAATRGLKFGKNG
jgi:hypothetical protein